MREDLVLNQLMSQWEKVTSRHPLLYLRWGHRLTWRAQRVWRLALRLESKFPARREQHVKERDVIFGTFPCAVITSQKGDAIMAIFAYVEMLMERKSAARCGRKRVLEQLRFWNTEKSKALCLKIQIRRSPLYGKLDKWERTLRRDRS